MKAAGTETPSLSPMERPAPCLVVTGASGYLGQKLVEAALSKTSLFVVGLDRRSPTKQRVDPRWRFVLTDLANPDDIDRVVSDLDESLLGATVVHLAGLFEKDVERSPFVSASDYERDNLHGTQNLARALAASAFVPGLVVFASSACLYDGSIVAPASVEDAKPTTAYGETKYLAEQILAKELKDRVRNLVILRFGRIVGIGEGNWLQRDIVSDFIEKVLRKDRHRTPFEVRSPNAHRPYLHVDDIVGLFLGLLRKPPQAGVVVANVSSERLIPVGEIAETVARVALDRRHVRGAHEAVLSDRTAKALWPAPNPHFQLGELDARMVIQRVTVEYFEALERMVREGAFPDIETAAQLSRRW